MCKPSRRCEGITYFHDDSGWAGLYALYDWSRAYGGNSAEKPMAVVEISSQELRTQLLAW